MPMFKCQMVDHDSDDEWDDMKAYDASMAAEEYAKKCESHSGGEMLNREDDREIVRVMDERGLTLSFSVYAYYSKNFIAHAVRPTDQQSAQEKL